MNGSFEGRGQGQWTGPRVGEAALSVRPIREVVAQSRQATISILELREYSEGIAIEVEATATTGNRAPHEVLRSGMETTSGDEPPPAVLRFSIRLNDGLAASTLDYPLTPSSAPAQPYFSTIGGPGYGITGNRLHTRQVLWLWPRPVSEQFELVAEWPIFGIAATPVSLNVSETGT